MYAVIFRAVMSSPDADYTRAAAELRVLAESFGCTLFVSSTEGASEIAISYWPDLESIAAWKRQIDHQHAQRLGRERWYASYAVDIAKIERSYRWPPDA